MENGTTVLQGSDRQKIFGILKEDGLVTAVVAVVVMVAGSDRKNIEPS